MAKRIAYNIDDIDALKAAYPQLVKEEVVTVTKNVVDKEKLYQLVKVQHALELTIPGVTIDALPPEPRDIESCIRTCDLT